MRIIYCLCFMTLSFSSWSQNLRTDFFNIDLPINLSYEEMKSEKEDLSNTDVFKINDSEKDKLKYLVYLISNRLNDDAQKVSEENLSSFVKDLGKPEILENKKVSLNDQDVFRLKLALSDHITGIVYVTSVNNVLYRALFMVPDKFLNLFEEEISSIMSSVSFLKDDWN